MCELNIFAMATKRESMKGSNVFYITSYICIFATKRTSSPKYLYICVFFFLSGKASKAAHEGQCKILIR